MIKKNTISFFKAPYSIAALIIVSVGMMYVFYKITNYELIRWNYGDTKVTIEIVIQMLLSLLFGMFVGLNVFRFRFFRQAKDHLAQTSFLGTFGAFAGMLVIGCPTCGITVASTLWLAGFLWVLPLWWHELKYVGIISLLIANFLLLRDLKSCKIRK